MEWFPLGKKQKPWKLSEQVLHVRRRRRRPCGCERGSGGYCPVSPQIPLHCVVAATDRQEGAHRPGASLWGAKGLSPNEPPDLRLRVSLPDIWPWEPTRLHPWDQRDAQRLEMARAKRTLDHLPPAPAQAQLLSIPRILSERGSFVDLKALARGAGTLSGVEAGGYSALPLPCWGCGHHLSPLLPRRRWSSCNPSAGL